MIEIADGYKTTFLETFRSSLLNTLTMHLYKNNFTPVHGMILSDFVEADFTGYAAQAITTFGSSTLTGGFYAQTQAALATFTQSGTSVTCDVYGYYMTDSGGTLVYAELNPNGVVSMSATGLTYVVLPNFWFDTYRP